VEPRLKKVELDDNIDLEGADDLGNISDKEKKAFWIASGVMITGLIGLFLWVYPESSSMRAPDGEITAFSAP
ncbi:MAG TPA: aminobenzoyl-glutamate transporter, partial [Balneola sp.]|nr:aminobenzoyl-glutamate transporter [Balneola sp.]